MTLRRIRPLGITLLVAAVALAGLELWGAIILIRWLGDAVGTAIAAIIHMAAQGVAT